MRKETRVLLTGGGSGGHITPNLAIASALRGLSERAVSLRSEAFSDPHLGTPKLRSENTSRLAIRPFPKATEALGPRLQFLYVGSRLPLDAELVKAAGLPFVAIFTGKWRRYFDWRHFLDPFLVILGFFQALWVVARFWPDVVFAKGGFVSLPVALAAFVLRRPLVLHESDQAMGLSNRLAAPLAKTVCFGFPPSARNPKFVFTGNPVNSSLSQGNREIGYRLTGFRPEKTVLLVWGGSQGALEINQKVAEEFPQLKTLFQIVHVTGKGKQIPIESPDYVSFDYLGESLPHIYAIAAMVVGRAGANSLSEIALLQKPNILIPLPGHQTTNAAFFESRGASVVLRDRPLHEVLFALWRNPEALERMKEALGALARPEAAEEIAGIILRLTSPARAETARSGGQASRS